MNRHARALFLSALIMPTASGCKSSGGTTVVVGGGPVGSGDCHERLATDSAFQESGITIQAHRIYATVSVWCTGDVAPATCKITLIGVKNNVHGADIATRTTCRASSPTATGVASRTVRRDRRLIRAPASSARAAPA